MKNNTPGKKKNPRTQNGAARKKLRDRVKAMGLPCALCGQPINYDLDTYVDKDGAIKKHPYSFELDEIVPTAVLLKQYGYEEAVRGCLDINNVQPTHRICNQRKGAATRAELNNTKINKSVVAPIPHYLDI